MSRTLAQNSSDDLLTGGGAYNVVRTPLAEFVKLPRHESKAGKLWQGTRKGTGCETRDAKLALTVVFFRVNVALLLCRCATGMLLHSIALFLLRI